MGASVMTVEHFLAAVAFTDARDLHVHISGEEMPILDGSASIWYRRFIEHGARPQVTLIPIATSGDRTPILIESESSRAEIVPIEKAEDAFIEVTLDMSTIGKPKETHRFHPTTDSFDDIASARTFAFEHEVETLKKTGLAKGGGFHNALILGPDGPKNPDGLRFPNEPARHKILDTMGDLFLLNALPLAQIRIFRPGHHLNHQIVRTIAIRP
jgi:UDP-3-O-[3-hydroxymyristoyl] N-acetylglucosamine deacetylase